MRNEIKISFAEPEYEVNLEKDTVECFLKYEVLYPDFLQGVFFYGEKVYLLSKAIAKVNSGDIFDENIGKKISLAKAEKKAYAKVRKRLIKRWSEVVNTLDVVGGFIDKAHDIIEHNDNYLEQWN